jgi:NADH:ubiquinone oxidoreductase subunit 6 (subunit J)
MPPHSPLTVLLWPLGACVLLGAVAVYLLLPRPRPYPPWIGGALGIVALVLTGVWLTQMGASVETVLFYIFAGVAIAAGVLLVTQANPARAALSFALVVLSTCGLFLLQAAPFLAAATVIIYAGAIIVTFLFVLMLAQQETHSDADWRSREPLLSCLAGFVLLAALLYVLYQTYWNPNTLDVLARIENIVNEATTPRERGVRPIDLPDGPSRLFEDVLTAARKAPHEPALARFEKAVTKEENDWFDVKFHGDAERGAFLETAVATIRRELHRARATLGDLQPDEKLPLSPFSGLPPNAASIPLDASGDAPMPAANTAHLGRSLFTDYLLAVELGGTLLLVATIGAIAIASRREEPT